VPAFAPLLAPLDLADVVVTTDALKTHPEAAWVPGHRQARPRPVRGQGQPAHPAGPLPASALAPHPGAGPHPRPRPRRIEVRTLKAVSVHQFGFPHAAQVLQVTRKTRDLHDHPGGARP
jgi:hypothetical protein